MTFRLTPPKLREYSVPARTQVTEHDTKMSAALGDAETRNAAFEEGISRMRLEDTQMSASEKTEPRGSRAL